MARRDGTGPMGAGPMTGRGLGYCIGENEIRYDARPRMGLGFGRPACRRGFAGVFSREPKDLLQEEKELLQNRLELIDEQLKNL